MALITVDHSKGTTSPSMMRSEVGWLRSLYIRASRSSPRLRKMSSARVHCELVSDRIFDASTNALISSSALRGSRSSSGCSGVWAAPRPGVLRLRRLGGSSSSSSASAPSSSRRERFRPVDFGVFATWPDAAASCFAFPCLAAHAATRSTHFGHLRRRARAVSKEEPWSLRKAVTERA